MNFLNLLSVTSPFLPVRGGCVNPNVENLALDRSDLSNVFPSGACWW